eukprot:TRINITY_DN9090_c0_g1_i1.p1 TRINITY_DN9090_c0_g1~~TRINITY_DN9090_c0_g1_i1.p1  ORF type:complete len:360 (-),score=91.20 TRINITY_DN9090_c0_g1_i1:426-1505(-)
MVLFKVDNDPLYDATLKTPYVPLAIPTDSLDTMEQGAKEIVSKLLPEWETIPVDQLQVQRIQGGITNMLFKIEATIGGEAKRVLVRVFGINTEILINRIVENELIEHLGNGLEFTFKLLGRFVNGRLEQFLNGIAVTIDDMDYKVARLVAAKMSDLHHLSVDLDKTPVLWNVVDKYINLAKSLRFDNPEKQKLFEQIDLAVIEKEVDLMKKLTEPLNAPVVFTHNDLLFGNILYDKSEETVTFIDLEYAACNYRGYDIGNHFVEYGGFDCNWGRYPDYAAQLNFLTEYLRKSLNRDPTEQEFKALYKEVNYYALMTHIHWGLWSLAQARYSVIDFDFLSYAQERFKGYFTQKDSILSIQ